MQKQGSHKPGQYRQSEENFKADFKEKIGFFKTFFLKKVIINCLILRLSIATQLLTNSLLTRDQFSFMNEPEKQMYLPDINRWNR